MVVVWIISKKLIVIDSNVAHMTFSSNNIETFIFLGNTKVSNNSFLPMASLIGSGCHHYPVKQIKYCSNISLSRNSDSFNCASPKLLILDDKVYVNKKK